MIAFLAVLLLGICIGIPIGGAIVERAHQREDAERERRVMRYARTS